METKDKYNSAYKTEMPTVEVPPPPKTCQHCSHPVDILLLSVYDDRGQVHTGPFGEYGYKKNGLHLKGGYTYAHWNATCSNCNNNPADWRPKLLKERFISLNIKQENGSWREPCMRAMKSMAFGKLIGGG